MATALTPPRPAFLHDRSSTKSRSSSLNDLAKRGRKALLHPMTAFLPSKKDKSSTLKAKSGTPPSAWAGPGLEAAVRFGTLQHCVCAIADADASESRTDKLKEPIPQTNEFGLRGVM